MGGPYYDPYYDTCDPYYDPYYDPSGPQHYDSLRQSRPDDNGQEASHSHSAATVDGAKIWNSLPPVHPAFGRTTAHENCEASHGLSETCAARLC